MSAQYDLAIDRGSNFDIWLQYLNENDVAVDLLNYSANMQLKRFRGAEFPLLFASKNGLTYGYTGGFTTGIGGIGGISLNTNYNGATMMGGIRISLDHTSTASLSSGKYFYDVKLLIGTTYAQKLLEGRIVVSDGVV